MSAKSLDEVMEMLDNENVAYSAQMPEMRKMLEAHRKEAIEALAGLKKLEKKRVDLEADLEAMRGGIDRRRTKGGGGELSMEDGVKELKKGAAEAIPVFIQSLCRYSSDPSDEDKKKRPNIKFWKKGSSSSPSVKLLHLNINSPEGAQGPCLTPASGVSLVLTCKQPTQSIEEMATEGGTVELVFGLRKVTEQTDDLINAAKSYFEKYFASRVKSEGGVPEIEIKLTETTMVVKGRLSVDRKQVGGVLGRIQELASGEFLSTIDGTPSGSPSSASSVPSSPKTAMAKSHERVLGKYTKDHAKEALSNLQHTSVSGSFQSELPFSEILRDGKMNWDFLNNITAGGQLVLERSVYKSIQKVVELFSTVSAAKMSFGGRIYKKLHFKVDSLLYRSLREDPDLTTIIEDHLERAMGQSVVLDDEIMHNLGVLRESLSSVRMVSVTLPAVTANLQFQGFDFFGIAADAAELARSKQAASPKPQGS